MVQTNTVLGPGGEGGVMRIKGTGTPGHERGLSMALDGNGRWQISIQNSAPCTPWPKPPARSPAPAQPCRRHQLPQFRKPRKAGDHGPALCRHRRHSPSLHCRLPSQAAMFRSITRPAVKASIPHQCSASSASSTMSPAPSPRISSGQATPSRSSGPSPRRPPIPISRFLSSRRPYIVLSMTPEPSFPLTAPTLTPVPEASADTSVANLTSFGSSEYAKEVPGCNLGPAARARSGRRGQPPHPAH